MIVANTLPTNNGLYNLLKLFDKTFSSKIFKSIDLANYKVGRPYKYSNSLILKLMLVMKLKRIDSLRSLERIITSDKQLQRELKITEVPDFTTLARRIKSLDQHFQLLYKMLITKFMKDKMIDKQVLILDSTALETSITDTEAKQGYCSEGYFYGYKAHLVTDKQGIPLNVVVTLGNKYDSSMAVETLKPLNRILSPSYIVADGAYDTERFYYWVNKNLNSQLISKPNYRKSKAKIVKTPYRKTGIDIYNTKLGQTIYRKRLTIESIFSQLKVYLGLENLRYIKGLTAVRCHTYLTVFTMMIANYYNFKSGVAIRRIKAIAA